jgi:5-methylcytosine-specific restriction protein A
LVRRGEGGYCETHKPLSPRKFADKARGTAAQRGYGGDWRRLRAQVLREEPICRLCEAEKRYTVSTHVDHIIP